MCSMTAKFWILQCLRLCVTRSMLSLQCRNTTANTTVWSMCIWFDVGSVIIIIIIITTIVDCLVFIIIIARARGPKGRVSANAIHKAMIKLEQKHRNQSIRIMFVRLVPGWYDS